MYTNGAALMLDRPSIIPRSEIPISEAPGDGALEVRPFDSHELLRTVLPSSGVALAWTRARGGQNVGLRSHAAPGLLVVLQGRALLIGEVSRAVEQGDVITIPGNRAYGFEAVGADGLHALHVAFRETADDDWVPTAIGGTLDELLARNEARARRSLEGPFFALLRDRALEPRERRDRYRDCMRVFSDAFQMFLLTRQAMCRDEEYFASFHEHLEEELGHNKLVTGPRNPSIINDPVLVATSSWFAHRMLVLDNAGKAVVNMALETAGYYFHTLAVPVFEGDEMERYVNTHAEDDAHHKDMCAAQLMDLNSHTYRHLLRVLDDAWDMFDAATTRIVELVKLHGHAHPSQLSRNE